jgi:hypothetical protein
MPPPKTQGPTVADQFSGPLSPICLQGLLLSGRRVLSGQPAVYGFILPNGLFPGWLGSVPIPLHGEPWSLGTEPFSLRNAETGEVATCHSQAPELGEGESRTNRLRSRLGRDADAFASREDNASLLCFHCLLERV